MQISLEQYILYILFPVIVYLAGEGLKYILARRPKLKIEYSPSTTTNYEGYKIVEILEDIIKDKQVTFALPASSAIKDGKIETRFKKKTFWHCLIIRNRGKKIAQDCKVRVALYSSISKKLDAFSDLPIRHGLEWDAYAPFSIGAGTSELILLCHFLFEDPHSIYFERRQEYANAKSRYNLIPNTDTDYIIVQLSANELEKPVLKYYQLIKKSSWDSPELLKKVPKDDPIIEIIKGKIPKDETE